ncbi:MAG TPA: DUF6161 domain-containing protein [Rhodanobacteraceae bacterium]|jgi:hypothetical protein|nr:DUF6161 domain-containing protein [Rhodanobacteraceae bacterium]
MSELPSKLEIPVYGSSGRVLTFERTEDVVDWAERQVKDWTSERQPQHNWLKQAWDQQRTSLTQIGSHARRLEAQLQTPENPSKAQQVAQAFQSLRNTLNQISQGTVLTTESPNFGYVVGIAEKDGDAACVLMLASRSDGAQQLSNVRQGPPLDAIARLSVAVAGTGEQSRAIEAYRSELASLKNDTEKELSALREALRQEVARSAELEREHTARLEDRNKVWAGFLESSGEEWDDLKRIYDEKLSLLAPTEYWNTRAKQYRNQGWGYAIVFAVVLGALIGLFAWLGINELRVTKATSVLIAILPVIIPAFAGVWVLRILGRQLSESLAIMKDAQERVTLVKTFLALMRDETTGKSVVKEEDRALILQALFRQSRVTAVDDSPPLNSLEALLKPFNR